MQDILPVLFDLIDPLLVLCKICAKLKLKYVVMESNQLQRTTYRQHHNRFPSHRRVEQKDQPCTDDISKENTIGN